MTGNWSMRRKLCLDLMLSLLNDHTAGGETVEIE